MFSLPAFLSFPFTLPSLPSISLPANIQRRFLSYVLKRALGRFVKAGGLDVERIQAQISEGWVEIEGLEVDTEAINSLIPPSIPLNITSGSLSKVTAKVPFPNLWSDPLAITLDQLYLDFTIAPPTTKGKSPASHPRSRSSRLPTSPSLDLASSFTSAADDFLHDELDAYEGAELDRSIRQSLILNQSDPFSQDEVPGAFPFASSSRREAIDSPGLLPATAESTTVLAGLVERILARLEFKVNTIRIRIRFEDEKNGGIFEVRIGEVRYADESEEQDGNTRQTIRAVRLGGIGICMLPLPTPRSIRRKESKPRFSSSSTRSSSTSSASSTTDSGDEYGDMVMSQAVADLRQSMASSIASGASVYQSAYSERPQGDVLESQDSSRSITPTGGRQKDSEPDAAMLLSFGTEEVVFRMKSTQPHLPSEPSQPDRTASSSGRPQLLRASTSFVNSQLPSLGFELLMGNIACVLMPRQTASVIAALQAVTLSTPDTSTPSDMVPTLANGTQPRIDARFRIKGFYLALVYDMRSPPADFAQSMQQYWTKPALTYLPIGHLKLKLEGFEASYISKGHATRPARSSSGGMISGRRVSISTGSAPRPPIVTIKLQDASIFEYLHVETSQSTENDDDSPPGGAFPVLLFDANLTKLYDLAPGVSSTPLQYGTKPSPPVNNHSTFPEFDCVDWRNSGLQRRAGVGEKVWKTRLKSRGVLKGATPVESDDGPSVTIRKEMSSDAAVTIDALPVHVFLDLSLVERLIPMLRSLAPIIKSPSTKDSPVITPATLRFEKPSTIRRDSQYIIDDLDAQASSFSTLRPNNQPKEMVVIRCPLVRLDIRCPAPLSRRGSWGDGAHLRSGIFTLDIHGIGATVGQQSPEASRVGTDGATGAAANVEWQKMVLFFCRIPEKRSTAFLVIGPLAPETSDDEDLGVLLPTITVKPTVAPVTNFKTQQITCRIPSVQAKIRQPTIEGLQFFADDMTHWLDGAFGDGSAPKPRDDLKMIGSRFFGSKGSSSSSSAIDDEDEEEGSGGGLVLRVIISEVDLGLHVPMKDMGAERVLSLNASDVDTRIESNVSGRQETALILSVMDAEFSDRTDTTSPKRICGRTTPLTLTTHTQTLLNLRFSSSTNPVTDTKESNIKLLLSHFTFFVTKDWEYIDEFRLFVKTPEGVFEDVVPTEITRVNLHMMDTSLHVSAPTLGGGIVVVLGQVEVKTDLISDSEESLLEVSASEVGVLAIDDLGIVGPLPVGLVSSIEIWKKAGFAQLVEVSQLDLQLLRELTGDRETVLDILQAHLKVTACADSLATVGALAGDMAKLAPAKESSEPVVPVQPPSTLSRDIDVFASIDQEAFHQIPDIVSGADMIDDDLPTNLDYLDQTTRPTHINQSTKDRSIEGLRSWESAGGDDERLSEVNGETIRILVDNGFDMEEDYLERLPVVNGSLGEETRLGNFRVRLHDCNVNIYLHDGFDWYITRKTIEDEIKSVRRRLEKIRQLLASGQKADETIEIEHASSTLFNSVYIGLSPEHRTGGEKIDTAALLKAIDDEIDDLGGMDTASQSSWQSLPIGGERAPPRTNKPKTKLRGRKLTRSKRAQIEISLINIRADYDLYDKTASTSSRVHVMVGRMEILDHIKTSTWKKFLTEMKADSRGNVRETDADMVRVELVGVRPSLPSLDEENRLRAKILPLRLHVDQDALDFLKRFFSFSAPPKTTPDSPVSKNESNEPFFQHVEVFPIELKLDYKPKRVDFAALREGRTIELMNFFHFDGAEMTLRHITLSGITGWSRLGNTLNDLWTPDVKANQLLEVISGVSPIRSLVNVGSGVADLILLPIEQYRKDGRLAKGMQRGAGSFVRSTGGEMMKLGARLATGTQVLLEGAEGMLGSGKGVVFPEPGDSGISGGQVGEARGGSGSGSGRGERDGEESDEDGEGGSVVVSRFANQPGDVREGVQAAYKSLSRNLNSAAQTILAVPMEVYERSGEDGPLRAVVRAVPIAVLKPMIGGAEAVSKTLLGMRNSLDPEGKRELGDKYK